MNLAVRAGRIAWQSGRMPTRLYASASSPTTGLVR
jgi:thiazole synthase